MAEELFVTKTYLPPFEEYMEAIRPLWDSHWITNMGKYHGELEEQLRQFLDVPHLSLMVNGHLSLEMVIQAMGFPDGSEVITTPFTFISTTHAIVRNHLQPVFCDVKEEDGTIDEERIENLITEKTVAIIPVHVYGNVCNVERIQEIADKYGLKVIYDAAHAFGIQYKNRGIGNCGDASIFSFHATKVFHTIEGGAVSFHDPILYQKLYDLKNFGIRNEELVAHVGANAKMSEFNAIMGLCNLRHFGEIIEGRKRVSQRYDEAFADIDSIRQLRKKDSTLTQDCNYAYYPVIVEDSHPCSRNDLYIKLAENGIHARKYFYPLTSDQACFKNKYRNNEIKISRNLADRVLTLPIYDSLSNEDIDRIVTIVREG